MGLYRDKGHKIPIEAEQWFPGKTIEGVRQFGERAFLDRLEGDVEISPGDWIIKGDFGHYAVSSPIFERIYEPAA